MSDIDKIRGYQPPSEGGGKFLKLADGETARVRITSLPVIFQNEYRAGEEVNISTRFAFVVWNHDQDCAQIWQTNAATYGQQISSLLDDEEYGDWREYDVKISRSGEKAQTRYNVRPGTKRYDLTDKQLDAVGSIDIIGILDKQESNSQVMWLDEWRDLEESAKKETVRKSAEANKSGIDKVREQLDDEDNEEPVNVDDIPF